MSQLCRLVLAVLLSPCPSSRHQRPVSKHNYTTTNIYADNPFMFVTISTLNMTWLLTLHFITYMAINTIPVPSLIYDTCLIAPNGTVSEACVLMLPSGSSPHRGRSTTSLWLLLAPSTSCKLRHSAGAASGLPLRLRLLCSFLRALSILQLLQLL